MFPRLPARATFVAGTKNVSDFVQKHFVSATNASQFAQPKKHHEQQCVRNNVSATMCPRLPVPIRSIGGLVLSKTLLSI